MRAGRDREQESEHHHQLQTEERGSLHNVCCVMHYSRSLQAKVGENEITFIERKSILFINIHKCRCGLRVFEMDIGLQMLSCYSSL